MPHDGVWIDETARNTVGLVGWFLLVLAFYMTVAPPSTLGEVAGLIDRVFFTVMGGITHFLDSAIKRH